MVRAEAEGITLIWASLFRSDGQFRCNPQTLPFTSHFGDVITNLFWRQAPGDKLGGQCRCGTDFPTVALQVYIQL